MATVAEINRRAALYPLLTPKERARIWGRLRGMWKGRRPDPIKELATMRREWERTSVAGQ